MRCIVSFRQPGETEPRGYLTEGLPQVDITEPEYVVEVLVSGDKKIVWVNIDGICALRVCRIPRLDLNT